MGGRVALSKLLADFVVPVSKYTHKSKELFNNQPIQTEHWPWKLSLQLLSGLYMPLSI